MFEAEAKILASRPTSLHRSHFRKTKRLYEIRKIPFGVTWLRQTRDHSIPHGPFPIGGPLEPSHYLGFKYKWAVKNANNRWVSHHAWMTSWSTTSAEL